ncbi:hypothetical protein [Caballeronia telluris]|uniref:hypothetical protein n=1 Tax=Caballeronia telluris TaxID=326475 RepID=UPI000B3EC4A8|nr:hypothetical protein [Caballeronia telluris]
MDARKLQATSAVDAALQEFDRIGRTAFLSKHGFEKSREHMLRMPETGTLYDARAIVGAAYGFAYPDQGPLSDAEIHLDEEEVEGILLGLGFEVQSPGTELLLGALRTDSKSTAPLRSKARARSGLPLTKMEKFP